MAHASTHGARKPPWPTFLVIYRDIVRQIMSESNAELETNAIYRKCRTKWIWLKNGFVFDQVNISSLQKSISTLTALSNYILSNVMGAKIVSV